MITRRSLIAGAGGAVGVLGGAAPAWAAVSPVSQISFLNLHTDERCKVVYREGGVCLPDALAEVNKVLRDHRTGDVHDIDVDLLDLLVRLKGETGHAGPLHVISGYRSPRTNAKLASASDGVATKSLHMQGKAIDIRAPGIALADLRRAALGLKGGGVGYYPKSDFVHLDTGRVRQW